MRPNSINQVLQRIETIEKRFAAKPAESFSHYINRAIDSGQKQYADATTVQVEQLVRATAQRHGVKPELALAVARTESGLIQQAVSPVGAIGVMQLMPSTASELGVRDIHDVRDNVDGGVRYLKQQLLNFRDERLAVAAYNAGPEAVNRYKGIPPYPETQGYVKSVFSEMETSK